MPYLELNNGCEMYYEEHGDAERTVMLIHGLGGCGLMWPPQIEALTGAGWRVVFGDWPSNGRSGPYEGECTIEMLADAFEQLAEHTGSFGRRLVVCGHSAGGVLAQLVYHNRPQSVSGLVLLQTSARFIDPQILPFVKLALPAYTGLVFHPALAGLAGRVMKAAAGVGGALLPADNPANIFAHIGELMYENERIAEETIAFASTDITALLPGIEVPTLIVASAFDQVIPLSRVREMHEGIPGSEMRVIDAVGHNAGLFFSKKVNAALLDFLSRNF